MEIMTIASIICTILIILIAIWARMTFEQPTPILIILLFTCVVHKILEWVSSIS